MPEIIISVQNKIPTLIGNIRTIVTDNSDYTIRFIFDDQWDEGKKTVYLIRSNGYAYPPVVINNDTVEVPIQYKAGLGTYLCVGVQQGNIKTSAAAHIAIRASAIDAIDDEAVQPSAELWNEVLQRLRDVEESISPEELERIVNEYLQENPITESVKSVNGQTGEVKLNAADIGALPASTQIPGKTSDLQNDSGFITRLVSDLANYYKMTDTYNCSEIDEKISAIPKFAISVVSALPASNISTTTVYLVGGGTSGDLYTEYIYVNGAWEILGAQRVNLTGYAKESWVSEQLGNYLKTTDIAAWAKAAVKPSYTAAEVGALPASTTIPTKTSQLADDVGFAKQSEVEQLSETIADKLDADKLPEAVNDALAQAKASGEFDGKTPVKSVDYLTPEEVAEIVEDAAVRAAELVDVPEGGGGSGGGELPKLVGKYVHSENKEIRPTALDLPTGVFTCASHGLNTGDPAMVVLDGLFRNIPYELISTTRVSDTHFTIRSIDNDTFTLQFAGDDITYPSELNTQIDVSKWHIEIAKKQIIVIEGFSAESVEVRFNGSYWGTSNYHLDISPVSNRTRLNTVYGGYDGRLRTTSNDTSICLSVEGILRVNNCVVLESSTIVPKTSASDYTYMVNNPDIAYNRVNEKHSTNIVPLTGRQVVNGIAIAQHYNGGHGAMLANGFTVEIYKYA